MRSFEGVTVAGRIFCLAAVFGLVIVSPEAGAVVSMLLVATVALVAVYVSLTTLLSPVIVVTVEAALIGLVIGVALPEGAVLLPYLVVLALIAGTSQGVVGVTTVILAQVCTVGIVAAAVAEFSHPPAMYQSLGAWLITGIIAGLIGSWLRETGRAPRGAVADGSYESARRILSQLRSVTKNLASGLDPIAIATEVVGRVSDRLEVVDAGVFVRTDKGIFSPLALSKDYLLTVTETSLAEQCWSELKPVITKTPESDPATTEVIAVPMCLGSRMVAVVVVRVSTCPREGDIRMVMEDMHERSLQLETAIAFDEIRSLATTEERRRLAREIHDGIAQEIASLGYLMDELQSEAESARQRDLAGLVRGELSRVVNDLRLSIFDLRSEVSASAGLGAALSDYVRQVGSRSNLTVHLTLDEAPIRLRAETETELLRIAGEAITNARKHSGAENLWVTCAVDPPFALLEIRDDGRGMSSARPDSYGLHIMKERAHRINARLEILQGAGITGTTVRIAVGESLEHESASHEEITHDQHIEHPRLVGG